MCGCNSIFVGLQPPVYIILPIEISNTAVGCVRYIRTELNNTYFHEQHIVSSSGTVKYSNEQPHTSTCSGTDDFCVTCCSSAGNVDLLKEDCIAYIRCLSCFLLRKHYSWCYIMRCDESCLIYFLADSTRCTKHYGGVSSGVSWCYLQQRHSSLPS